MDYVDEPQAEADAENGITNDELEHILSGEIEDAIDYIDNTISPDRARAESYYLGDHFGNEEDGRSTAISMDVRDTVQAMLPSLMRIFYGGEKVVEFAPQEQSDVAIAKQANDYINYVCMTDNTDFFNTLYATFKDALVKKCGFIKYYWDDAEDVHTYTLTGLDDDALAVLSSDNDVEIQMEPMTAENPHVKMDPQTGQPIASHTVKVTRRTPKGRVKIEAVPPEEILVSRNARSLNDSDLIAHRRYLTLSELVEMGYDYNEIEEHATSEDSFEFNVEATTRNPLLQQTSISKDDPTMRRALYVESYFYADVDGDNVAELRRICTIGDAYKIYRNEPCETIPICCFQPDPEPHTFFGLSVADVVMDVQKIKSSVLRSSLDSLALSTHPRVGVVEGQASLDDVLNTEVGGVIRMRQPGAVIPFTMPFVGKDCFPMLDYYDQIRENRTGVSKAAEGLDPGALQSSTKQAVNQTIQAAHQRIEMIARMFAETGMKDLYRGVLRLVVQHQDRERMIRLRNDFVPMDPRFWNVNMDVVVTAGLGKGSEEERASILAQIAGKQEQILQTLGPENPLVNMQQYYNTLSRMTELSGLKDVNSYWSDPAQYQPPEPTEPEPDVNEQLIQVQMQSIQADIQKKAAELELEREKMMRNDDRMRDKDEADQILKAAEIAARYGAQVDTAEIRALGDRDREVIRNRPQPGPMGVVNG